MSRILVVDDSDLVRGSLRALLADAFPGAVVGEAAASGPALAALARERWDMVLLDLSLPDRDGVRTLREIRRLHPKLPVVLMSLPPEAEYGAAMRAAGATDYISKGSSPAMITAAVRQALTGVS